MQTPDTTQQKTIAEHSQSNSAQQTQQTNIVQANQEAARRSNENIGAIMASCPLMQPKIQLLPMRYAIGEAGQAINSNRNNSLYRDKEVVQGMRPLESGFLYCIHSAQPELLKEFAFDENGNITGRTLQLYEEVFQVSNETALIFERKGSLNALFMPVALSAERANILLQAKDDQKNLMNQLDLSSLNPEKGSPGFLPPQQLSRAVDFSNLVAPDSSLELGFYQWLKRQPWYPDRQLSLVASVEPEYKNDHGILLVNDICSDIREIAEQRNHVLETYQAYCETKEQGHSHIERFEVAQLLKQLMATEQHIETTQQELLQTNNIVLDDQAQQKQFKQLVNDLFYAMEDPDNFQPIEEVNYLGQKTSSYRNLKAEALAKKLKQEFGITKGLDSITRENVKRYHDLVNGKRFGGTGMTDVLQTEKMNTFIKEYQDKAQWYAQQSERYTPLMKKVTQKWHLLAAYISPHSQENLALKLDYEDICTCFFINNDEEWLHSYYLGDNEFPLSSVYSDIDNTKSSAMVASTIAFKFMIYANKISAVEGFENKIKRTWNSRILLSNSFDLDARIIVSLGLKQDPLAALLGQGIKVANSASGTYIHNLEAFFNNISPGSHRLTQLILEVSGSKWAVPEKEAVDKLQASFDKRAKQFKQHHQVRQDLKKIESQRVEILKIKSQQQRKLAHQQYSADIRQIKQRKKELESLIKQTDLEIRSNTTAKTALISGKAVISLSDKSIQWSPQRITEKLKGIGKELTYSDGKLNTTKLGALTGSSVLTLLYTFSAWSAWQALPDEEQDSNILDTLAITGFAAAAQLSLLNTVVSATLSAQLSRQGQFQHRLNQTLARLSRWAVYSTTTATFIGTIAMGVRTYNTWKDWSKVEGQSWIQQRLSVVRMGSSIIGTAISSKEAWKYAQIIHQIYKGGLVPIDANTALLRAGAKFVRINLWLWVIFYLLDTLWQYYRWPHLVSWANNTLWGNNTQQWSLEKHYRELEPELVEPSMHHQLNTTNNGINEVEIRFLLPNVAQPDKNNLHLAIYGFSKYSRIPKRNSYRFYNTKSKQNNHAQNPQFGWIDLQPLLKTDCSVESLENGSSMVTFYLNDDLLRDKNIDLIRFGMVMQSDNGDSYRKLWIVSCLHKMTSLFEVTQTISDQASSFKLTPWDE